MKEQWKTFAGGNYAVSNKGRVKRVTPGRRTKPGQLLTLNLMKIGYYRCAPVVDGRNVPMYVHHIVARAFLGPCPDGLELNHIDGDKTNNRVDNLEYVTHSYNMQHAVDIGTLKHRYTIPDSVVDEIRQRREAGESVSVIAEDTGVSARHCRDIINRKLRTRRKNYAGS